MPTGIDNSIPNIKNCPCCGKSFKPSQNKQKYCSDKCCIKYWKMQHLDKRNFWDKRWQRNDYKLHPEKWKAKNDKHNLLKRKSGYHLSKTDWMKIKQKYGFICVGCGIKESKKTKLTVDHILPLSRGGEHIYINIQPLCLSCNCRKGANLASKSI